ncbi:hypothetical protein MSAN_02042700 [Mycena sanguinolenta]|uniref:Uncharacterized protein n=1 Tax=Mycena sanguinolenta TaxID=230812 RepID=A0A8H6XJZ6_9AGAR|nr:hypothetical protein MSAN_02042700 [Mycena sanguinolenta]
MLSSLRAASTSTLKSTSIPIPYLPPALRARHFSVTNKLTGDGEGMNLWAPLLHPDHLQHLELVGNPRFFGEDVDAIPTFPRVHTLTIGVDYSTMAYNLSILSKFPAVRDFTMNGKGVVRDGPDGPGAVMNVSTILPILQQYTCDCKAMALFLPRPTLTHLFVDYCTPREFASQLHSTNNVISLDIGFNNFDIVVLETLCASFPMLTELCIYVHCEVKGDDELEEVKDHAATFFDELGDIAVMPAGLQRFALTWTFRNVQPDDDDDSPLYYEVKAPELDELRDGLEANCLALTTLWLDGCDFLLSWRKLPDGSVEEDSIVYDGESLQMKRGEFGSFWGTD